MWTSLVHMQTLKLPMCMSVDRQREMPTEPATLWAALDEFRLFRRGIRMLQTACVEFASAPDVKSQPTKWICREGSGLPVFVQRRHSYRGALVRIRLIP